MQWAVEQFTQTNDGKRIKVNLIPKGSLEAAQFAIEAMTDQDELVGDA